MDELTNKHVEYRITETTVFNWQSDTDIDILTQPTTRKRYVYDSANLYCIENNTIDINVKKCHKQD